MLPNIFRSFPPNNIFFFQSSIDYIMDFYDVIKSRRSVRKFTDEPVPEEKLRIILEAARLCPTWANKQGVRYIVVKDSDRMSKLRDATGQKWTKTAPMFVVVCIDPRRSGINKNRLEYFMVDAAIGFTHMILAATNEGLGTCWIGWFDEEAVQNILEIPKKVRVIGITPLGFPDYTPKPQERLALEEIVYEEKFKNKN